MLRVTVQSKSDISNISKKMFTFFIQYGSDNVYIRLSENNTVEDLKYEIYEHFKIRLSDQEISGWSIVPSSEEILLSCLNLQSENVLYVNHKNRTKMSLNDLSREPSCSSFRNENYLPNLVTEINDLNASIKFNLYYAENFSPKVPFYTGTFQQAVAAAFFKDDSTKCMFLYLHKPNLDFSQTFCKNIENEAIIDIISSYVFLGWNLDDEEFLPELKDTVFTNLSQEVAKDVDSFLSHGKPILLLLGYVEEEIIVVNAYQECFQDNDDFIYHLSSMLQLCNEISGNRNSFGSRQFQQMMCDSLGNRDYDCFLKHEYSIEKYLLDKVGFALYGSPTSVEEDKKYGSKEMKVIEDICKKLIEYGNCLETSEEINIAFLYCCTEPLDEEKEKKAKKYFDYDPHSDMTPKAIFCVRRCQGSNDPCRYFIDSSGRVYKSWDSYLKNNKEQKCKLILPQNGRYSVSESDKVLLEEYLSQDRTIRSRIVNVLDNTGTGLGFGSAFIMIGAAIPAITIAPVVLTGALVTGAAVGVYSIGRSANTIIDRGIHSQTLSFSDTEARSAYINIVAGSLGFVGAGATQAMSLLASRGVNIGQGARIAINVLNGSNIAVGGVNVVNQGYAIYENYKVNKEAPSALMVLQLSTSILFFGHSLYNFRTAATIVDEAQLNTMQEINDSLRSNRHRKTFNKYTKETIRLKGDVRVGRAEVIQSFSKIQNKDEVFAFLTRNNKNFNKEGIRFSADASTGLKLNGVSVNIAEIISMSPQNRATILGDLPGIPSSSSLVATPAETNSFMELLRENFQLNLITYCGKAFIEGQHWKEICAGLINQFSRSIQCKLIELIRNFMEIETFNWKDMLKKYFPNIDSFYFILRKSIDFVKVKAEEYKEDYERKRNIAEMSPRFIEQEFNENYFIHPNTLEMGLNFFEKALDMCFQSGGRVVDSVVREFIEYLAHLFTTVIVSNEEQGGGEQMEVDSRERGKIPCKDCGGYYFK